MYTYFKPASGTPDTWVSTLSYESKGWNRNNESLCNFIRSSKFKEF